jgi:hypothetical protein
MQQKKIKIAHPTPPNNLFFFVSQKSSEEKTESCNTPASK